MPLLDHFHGSLPQAQHWESFHVTWAGAIADALNASLLPRGYFAEEHAHIGAQVEIDMADFHSPPASFSVQGDSTSATWTAPPPPLTTAGAFPESFGVQIFQHMGKVELVAAVELISPTNKGRADLRRASAAKYAGLLAQGISLVLVDIVTEQEGNVHFDVLRLLGSEPAGLPLDGSLYAVAYRPVEHNDVGQIDVWPVSLEIGRPMPILPLALHAALCTPLDLEATYMDSCRRRHLV